MKQKHLSDLGSAASGAAPAFASRWKSQAGAVGLAAVLPLLPVQRTQAENHAGYRFGSYLEDGGRVQVETHAGSFEQRLAPWLTLKGEVVYDAVSGATPTGTPPPSQVHYYDLSKPNSSRPPYGYEDADPKALPNSVYLQHLHDIRWAGGFEPTISLGAHRITPGFSYSEEHDYISYGASLNYSVDLNEKNTTLNAGWSHNWDKVYANGSRRSIKGTKNTDDIILGINQILGPKTVLSLNLTYGNSHGYLDDPYKGVLFDGLPQFYDPNSTDPLNPGYFDERRPRHRHRYIANVVLTQAITPLHASVEGSYRFFHDSYGINAHTLGLTWFQKLGKRVTIAPTFRYYRQNAADFYTVRLPDMPADDPQHNPAVQTPTFYSADYRLSEMETFSYGVSVSAKVTDWLSLEASYNRYEMFGLDGTTSPTAYPKAHMVSAGFRLWY